MRAMVLLAMMLLRSMGILTVDAAARAELMQSRREAREALDGSLP